MNLILRYLKNYKGLVLLNLLGVFGFALVELGIPTIMAKVIDNGIAYNDINYIKRMGFIIISISILGAMGSILLGYTSANISTKIIRDIRNDIFKKAQSFSHSEYDKFGISSMITRTTNDAFQVMQFTKYNIKNGNDMSSNVCYKFIYDIKNKFKVISNISSYVTTYSIRCIFNSKKITSMVTNSTKKLRYFK